MFLLRFLFVCFAAFSGNVAEMFRRSKQLLVFWILEVVEYIDIVQFQRFKR